MEQEMKTVQTEKELINRFANRVAVDAMIQTPKGSKLKDSEVAIFKY